MTCLALSQTLLRAGCAALLAAGAAPGQAEPAPIRGVVVGPDGLPVAGAELAVDWRVVDGELVARDSFRTDA
ncbi:MAG: hypothetical protein H8E31_13220 [Planctomycetes bacterium]|nr:hypothetical protein [Planctomycetota bacterium]